MVEALAIARVIPPQLADELMTTNRYRNLLFHGRIDEVDIHVLNELRKTKAAVATLQSATPTP